MSFLARLSLRNRSLIALATIAILLIGAFVIPTLKQELFPSLDFPAVSVVTVDAGASPTIVEHDITDSFGAKHPGNRWYSTDDILLEPGSLHYCRSVQLRHRHQPGKPDVGPASQPGAGKPAIRHHTAGSNLQRRLSAGYSTSRYLVGGSCHSCRAG